jgi:hypothetical protein
MLIDKSHPEGKLGNFRHLGGILTDHGVTRENLSFRADNISSIDDEEAERLASLELSW